MTPTVTSRPDCAIRPLERRDEAPDASSTVEWAQIAQALAPPSAGPPTCGARLLAQASPDRGGVLPLFTIDESPVQATDNAGHEHERERQRRT